MRQVAGSRCVAAEKRLFATTREFFDKNVSDLNIVYILNLPNQLFIYNFLGQLVLAGDPKQLGPVLRSPIALKHGLQISLLERLMNNSECYQKFVNSHQYPSKCITKLLNNFRSHESLLTLPSRLFYENELKPQADPFKINSMLKWSRLPNPQVTQCGNL